MNDCEKAREAALGCFKCDIEPVCHRAMNEGCDTDCFQDMVVRKFIALPQIGVIASEQPDDEVDFRFTMPRYYNSQFLKTRNWRKLADKEV